MQLTQASNQWASRPADQRFTSLTELHEHVKAIRNASRGSCVSSRQVMCAPIDGDTEGLMAQVQSPSAPGPMNITHWTFGQLAQRFLGRGKQRRIAPRAAWVEQHNQPQQNQPAQGRHGKAAG